MTQTDLQSLLENVAGEGFMYEAGIQQTLDEKDPQWVNVRMYDLEDDDRTLWNGRVRYLGVFENHQLVELEMIDEDDHCMMGRYVMEADPCVLFAVMYV